jgi:hypothetical protein
MCNEHIRALLPEKLMLDFILSTRAKSPNLYVSFKNPLTGKYGTKLVPEHRPQAAEKNRL